MKSYKPIIISLAILVTQSLTSQYTVSSAEELGLRPVEEVDGTDILGQYFETADDSQQGCWVHHHPNGADFVVTPKIWGEIPNDTRKKLIHEAMLAITDAREAYGKYGNLSTNLYYILDDVNRADAFGEAFWIVNKSCWMQSGVPSVHGLTGIERQQVYAHEVGHCLIMENLNNYTTNYDMNDWFDESVAEYLSSEVYPESNFEHRFANSFSYNLPFRQAYSAFPLWKYYVDKNGYGSLVSEMQSLVDRTSLNARRNFMRDTGFDRLLHNFYFDLYFENFMDTDGRTPIPSDLSSIAIVSYDLIPTSNRLAVENLPMDRLNALRLRIPPGYDLSINPLAGGSAPLNQSLTKDDGMKIRNWASTKIVEGDCESMTSVLVFASHLNNEPLTGLHFDYTLTEKKQTDCCDETIPGDCNDCLAAADELSTMGPNPVDHINSIFKFDYKIEAVVNFQMADTDEFNPEYYSGDPNELKMVYYVNSADGSILFPGGPAGFFKTNLSYPNRFGRIDGAIWLANGQMVVYGYDAEEGRNIAVTRESARSANDRWNNDYLNMMQFFSSSEELAEHPEPMPEHVHWNNITKGYKGKLIEGPTGIENTWTIYFDTAPTPIKTSCILMGYMVGVLKDVSEDKCNRLIVYSKVNIGGEDSGDSIEAVLNSIKPMGISFDGTDYTPFKVGGDYGTAAFANLDDFEARLRSIEIRRQTAERQKARCMGMQFCIDRANTKLEELEKEKSEVICEQMVSMGMEDTFEECMRNEGY